MDFQVDALRFTDEFPSEDAVFYGSIVYGNRKGHIAARFTFSHSANQGYLIFNRQNLGDIDVPSYPPLPKAFVCDFGRPDVVSREDLVSRIVEDGEKVEVLSLPSGDIARLREGTKEVLRLNLFANALHFYSTLRMKSLKAFQRVDNVAARRAIAVLSDSYNSALERGEDFSPYEDRMKTAFSLLVRAILSEPI